MSEQPGSGSPQDQPHGYLIPSDEDRGVSGGQPTPPPPPPPPAQQPPQQPSQPAFTLPSAEPDSPVSSPASTPQSGGGWAPPESSGTTSIPVGSEDRGQGSYASPDTPYSGPPSGPPAYNQSGPPAYNQSGPPAYGQPSGQPAGGQPPFPGTPAYPPPQQQQYGGVPQYGQQPPQQPPPQQPYGMPQPQYGVMLPPSSPPKNGMAIGGMIAGIGSCAVTLLSCCGGANVFGISVGILALLAGGAGLAMSLVARNQIKASGQSVGGGSFALTGIITGACGGGLAVLGLILHIAGVALINSSSY